jgi:carbonic anhydrase
VLVNENEKETAKMKKFAFLHLVLLFSLVIGLMAFSGTAAASGPVHWGYEGEEGPEHWGELSPDFAACSEGMQQSPIDIPATAPVNPADIVFNYQPTALNIVNNGHTIKADYDEGSSIEIDGKAYNLLQFHFHALSENTIDGNYSDMEMHLVHQSDDGEYAVVGVMMDRGAENPAYAPVWDNMPAEEGDPQTISGTSVNGMDLLPQDQSYYRFDGSFTTPPCTEGVKWFVMSNPVELSDAQVATFEEIYSGNYRPVQPLNDRTFLITSQMEPEVQMAPETEMEPETQMEAEPQTVPETLPQSGGAPLPIAGILTGLGMLLTGTGLYLRRR